MSQENQGTNSAALENLPVKRKRGRPRKDGSVHGAKTSVTPASEAAKRIHRRKINPTAATDNAMVGRVVSGVLDGSFDAGYLLTVKVGDTDTILRGVVFEPGLSLPISGANDVAPHLKMFRRNETPNPVVDPPTQVHGSIRQPQQKNEQSAKLLQRNKGSFPPKVPPPVKQVPKAASQVLPNQIQTGPGAAKGVSNGTNHVTQAALQALQQAEVKTESPASLLAGGWPCDVNQVVQDSSQTLESQIEKGNSTDMLPKDETGLPQEGGFGNTNQTLLVTPKQAVQSELKEKPASATQPFPLGHNTTVKPAGVLQEDEASCLTGLPNGEDAPKDSKSEPKTEQSIKILQGSEIINKAPQVQHQFVGSKPKPDQPIDDALKGQEVEHNYTPVAAAPQAVATQLIAELTRMLQENQTRRKCDTPQDVQAKFSVQIPRRDETSHLNERPLNEAIEVTGRDSLSEPKSSQPVEMLQREALPAAPYDQEVELAAEQSALPKEVPEPEISNSTVPSKNEDLVPKDAVSPLQSQSDHLESINNTDSIEA